MSRYTNPIPTLLYLINIMVSIYFCGLITTPMAQAAGVGHWQLLQKTIGIPAMHMQLLNNDRVVIFDRTDFGKSTLPLPAGKCRKDPYELVLKTDCTAHSVEYNALTNGFRPLMVQTDVWCSSGSVSPDGRLIQTGGFNDGARRVRIFAPCNNGACDWTELANGLNVIRWYATNQILPDGRAIIIGGRAQFNYEYYPKTAAAPGLYNLPFLKQTSDAGIENNLYPFVFLCPDGNLFIFANNRAILFNYNRNLVLKYYPTIPGGDPRSYPSTGSAALLPLKAPYAVAEVLICGGAPKGSFLNAIKGVFVKALDTCARMRITDKNPTWVMEKMPLARVMGDMVLLPNGNVLIVNGGSAGTAGWEYGRYPVLNPVTYRPDNVFGSRFEVEARTTIPRMYHSSAILLRDGRVLVGGSNPHSVYRFTNVLYPTELSLEAFSPPYLDARYNALRPNIVVPVSHAVVRYGQNLVVRFGVAGGKLMSRFVTVNVVSPSFATHSFSQNQRLVGLRVVKVANLGKAIYEAQVVVPASGNVLPAGFYMLYVVYLEIPSVGVWVQVK